MEEALSKLAIGANTAADGRSRFFWQLTQARLCVEAGAYPLALATLRHLDDLIDQHELEIWEPEAVAESALLLRGCLINAGPTGSANNGNHQAEADAALARLVRSNPVMAARALGLGLKS
jgi:hypothetical protein